MQQPLVTGHNPEYMELSFDFENKNLRCLIVHEITEEDYSFHFIENIRVKRGVVLLVDKHYTAFSSYPNTSEISYGFKVDAFHGDKLDVTAYCSLGGQISGSITLWDPASPTPSADLSLFVIFSSMFIILSVVNMALKRKMHL